MRKMTFIILCVFFVGGLQAQEDAGVSEARDTTYWDSEFSVGFNFNQASFSGNWKAGGVNSIAFGSIATGKANYAKDKFSWDNQLELIYGVVKNEGQDFRKSNDRIFFDSKVGYKINEKWAYFSSVNFITQFTDGFDFSGPENRLISGFFAPAFLTTGFGLEYKPNKDFALRLAPVSPRFTFVSNPDIITNVPENYGVPAGQTVRTEWLAFQLFATYNKKISENLTINSRYQLFANYETLAFNTIDHRLDFTVIAKITKYVDVTFTSINVYDIDMDPGIQFSQALAMGILYKVSNKK
ncbi:DUF3078 domain-containing protein [Mongoliitalea daihaiensis]|uniref:DUF3078 domain-containing protein n=1 Tax=Mongoliitalea daihaiensis TaxID=2782006 RepID=UPI001F391816|nr:DUF3078 domain-containing protein [Mongoliitalea daihaiensis]